MRKAMHLIATFFYAGHSKYAPGTVGTLAALPLVWAILYWGPFWQMVVTVLMIPLAIVASQVYETDFQDGHDSSKIVIDEVVGFLVTMVWMPLTWQAFLVGFVLFRLLDIFKPFPISYLDKNVPGGAGVVVDDLLAGLIANVVMQILLSHTAILGTQIIQSDGMCLFSCG
ncbi:MAG: phosphatidylglycerophosphatase A [Pseudobdellovibrionaceae bacterium]|jgi:phosphatidylglycerophosphatase A